MKMKKITNILFVYLCVFYMLGYSNISNCISQFSTSISYSFNNSKKESDKKDIDDVDENDEVENEDLNIKYCIENQYSYFFYCKKQNTKKSFIKNDFNVLSFSKDIIIPPPETV